MKTTALLDQLSPADQQQILFWIETTSYRETLGKIAAEPPEGFGLKTHLASLARFYARHQKSARPEAVGDATNLTTVPDGQVLDQGTVAAVRQAAFDLACAPQLELDRFKSLARWVLRLREQEHAAKELALEEKRYELSKEVFQFNAARAALQHAAELQQILEDSGMDNEAKILRARERLFGIAPEQSLLAESTN